MSLIFLKIIPHRNNFKQWELLTYKDEFIGMGLYQSKKQMEN